MKCLETRQRRGMKWRRYRDDVGTTVTTLEVPEEVLSHIGAARLAEALERAQRQYARRRRNAHALSLLREGWKTTAVAHEIGLSESMVRRLAQVDRAA